MSVYSSLTLLLLFLFKVHLSKAMNGGFSVEIIHRDSSKSPFYHSTQTHFQRVANALPRSINRANHLNKPSISSNTPETTVTPDRGEYLMSYSIGTPPFQYFGIVDTGSDIIWLQCQPCESCYNQTAPIFNPSKSKTYKTLPCTSTTCQSVKSSCSSDICGYTINYDDGSHSQGDIIVETLTLASTNGSLIKFPRTVIGCGHNNNIGIFQGKNSGVVGLGLGPLTLISQLSSSIGGKFSYCLVPMFTQSQSSSKLNFGDAALVSGNGTVSTPIVFLQDKQISYFLTIEALSVGNTRIDFSGVSSGSGGEGNIIIDSGTTFTLLPEEVYYRFEAAVHEAINLEPVPDPFQQLNLCYKIIPERVDVPVITAHFRGADVKLNAINTFVQVNKEVVCLAFIPSENGAIFGNLAQQNFLVGYDLQEKTVSFNPTDCTKV